MNYSISSLFSSTVNRSIADNHTSSTQQTEKIETSSSFTRSKKWQKLWLRWSYPENSSQQATLPPHLDKVWEYNKSQTATPKDEEDSIGCSDSSITVEEEYIEAQCVDDETKKQALIALCKSLMMFGAPCHRIEQALEHVSAFMSISTIFVFIPGIMMMTFFSNNEAGAVTLLPTSSYAAQNEKCNTNNNDKDQTIINCSCNNSQTILVRCTQGLDMGKLAKVNDIIQAMCMLPPTQSPSLEDSNINHEKSNIDDINSSLNHPITIQQSIDLLNGLLVSKPTWSPWIMLISYTMCSLLSAPVMFNGSVLDTALSGALGFLVGLLILLSEQYTVYSNVFEISTTILVAIIAKALSQRVCFTGVVLSATSLLIPGYTITMSIMELSSRHVITGTIRFVYSMIYALFIGYGLEIGTSIYEAFDTDSLPSKFDACSGSVPTWLYSLLFPFMAISMSINLGATVKQWPAMVCCAAIGFAVSVSVGKVISNFQIIGTISAFSVGIFGNLYFRFTGDMALVPLSCAIVSLVPGSVGIQGAYFLMQQDDQGASFAMQMVVASLGISVGLFAATIAVSANERKRSAFLSY